MVVVTIELVEVAEETTLVVVAGAGELVVVVARDLAVVDVASVVVTVDDAVVDVAWARGRKGCDVSVKTNTRSRSGLDHIRICVPRKVGGRRVTGIEP